MPTEFIGYSRNRFDEFKKEKVRIFREKNGWFAKQEDSSLNMNSTQNNFSVCESGTIMALDLLYSDNTEKMNEIRQNCKKIYLIVFKWIWQYRCTGKLTRVLRETKGM